MNFFQSRAKIFHIFIHKDEVWLDNSDNSTFKLYLRFLLFAE